MCLEIQFSGMRSPLSTDSFLKDVHHGIFNDSIFHEGGDFEREFVAIAL